MAVLTTGFGKSMIFFRVCARQKRIVVCENQYHYYFAVEEHHQQPNFRDVIAELHSNGIVGSSLNFNNFFAAELSLDVLCPLPV